MLTQVTSSTEASIIQPIRQFIVFLICRLSKIVVSLTVDGYDIIYSVDAPEEASNPSRYVFVCSGNEFRVADCDLQVSSSVFFFGLQGIACKNGTSIIFSTA